MAEGDEHLFPGLRARRYIDATLERAGWGDRGDEVVNRSTSTGGQHPDLAVAAGPVDDPLVMNLRKQR
jgi:hypothetical protein